MQQATTDASAGRRDGPAARGSSRRGPVEGEAVIGVDADRTRRPGVPMEATPDGAAARRAPIARQATPPKPLIRAGLDRPTAVYGSAQPPHGLSGAIRRAAYGIPEHFARHWMLLLMADRVDVLEDRAGPLAARPFEAVGLDGAAATVRGNPLAFLAGAMVGVWGLRKLAD